MQDELVLTEEEKQWCADHIWENMFDQGLADDVHYLDPPMVKLLAYLGIEVPGEYENTDKFGDKCFITLVANQ